MLPVAIFSLIIFCESIQVWLMLAAVLGHVPQGNVLNSVVFPEWQLQVRPERDAVLFHCFIVLALLAQAVGIWFARGEIKKYGFVKKAVEYLAMDLFWIALMLNAYFKSIAYADSPWMAQAAFIALSIGSYACKIFWPEVKAFARLAYNCALTFSFGIRADVMVGMLIIIVLFIPDTQAVLARMFIVDQFHHFDTFLAPAWGYAKGSILNVDVMTEYGIGLPATLVWFCRLVGGVTYVHALWFWVWGSIIYFIICYIFLRRWLGSFGIALAGVLLVIKFQMFHSGVSPFIFTLPSATVMRYFPDIIFFSLLLGHIRSLRMVYLIAAGICCGFQIFYMTTAGYCLGIAFYIYVAAMLVTPHLRALACSNMKGWMGVVIALVSVPVSATFWLYLTQGAHLWTHEFWFNMAEFNNYFISGFGLMPMYETLQHKETLACFMGFFIPLVYMATAMIVGACVYFQKANREDIILVVMSFYGLLMYHYYIARSAPTSYYVVCIPYVFILCFWANRFLKRFDQKRKCFILLAILGLVFYGLATNHAYLAYPNIFNLSRNPIVDQKLVRLLPDGRSAFNQLWTKIPENEKLPLNSLGERDEGLKFEKDFKTDQELVKYYNKEFNFKTDAVLIDSLTRPDEAVALLSSFEVQMLIQADRKPFFYYYPILLTRPMRMRTIPNATMYTSDHAARILKQMEDQKPPYVFMEKIILNSAKINTFKDASMVAVLNYLFSHYAPDAKGQYLVAMKRKD